MIDTSQIDKVIERNCKASCFTSTARLSMAVKIRSSASERRFVFSESIVNQIPALVSYSPLEADESIAVLSALISSKSSTASSFLKSSLSCATSSLL